jgi:hypothetical protein
MHTGKQVQRSGDPVRSLTLITPFLVTMLRLKLKARAMADVSGREKMLHDFVASFSFRLYSY